MFWTQSHSDTCTHIPFPTCFVAVRPTLKWTCRNSREKNNFLHYFLRCTRGYSPGLNATFENSSIPLINWEAGHCRFEKLWGKNSLNATLNGRSHYNKSPEPLIWGLFDHSPSESYPSLSLFRRYLCLSLSVSLSRSNRFVQPLVLLHYCSVQKCSIIPLSGLFPNISDLRQGCHWRWTKKNWGEMVMGTDLYGSRQDWVIDNRKPVNTTHSRLGWNKKVETRQD